MFDFDLAKLYGVETKRLNEAVKRNRERFPDDFMFQLVEEEVNVLRSQIATFKYSISGRKYLPFAFTETGVAMLSSVLTGDRAAQVNISIMRTFVRLRSFLALETTISDRVGELEKGTNQLFQIVFRRLDDLEETLPTHPKDRKKIGLKHK